MNKIDAIIDSEFGDLKSQKIFIACSGGIDSIALAHILKKLKFDISVLHMNYHLREEESNKDEAFVEKFCQNRNIPFFKRESQIKEHLKSGGNLQELARNDRYNWFNEILAEKTSNYIALGHHADDQIETFYLNLARNAGVMGMACMLARKNRFIRPLLKYSKKELIAYAQKEQLEWREDASNKNLKYARNKLRNKFLPEISKEITTLNSSVLILVEEFQKLQTEIEFKVKSIVKKVIENSVIEVIEFKLLNEFEKIEFVRQLNLPVSTSILLNKLNTKGTKIELSNHQLYSSIEFANNCFYFIGRSTQINLPKLQFTSVKELPKTYSKDVLYLDKTKIKGEINVRQWEPSDRIKPIGMKGTQLVSDIISDAKLNPFEKKTVQIVCDQKNILWVVGLKIGSTAIATNQTTDILKIKLLF